MKHMDIAERFLNLSETNHTKILNDYFKKQSNWQFDVKSTPWCAAFVNSVLHEAGFPITGSFMARSFLKYGTPVTKPQQGDVVVFVRGKAPSGHVAFYDSNHDAQYIRVLGGNQADKVCYKLYHKNNVLGYRRP